MPNEIRRSRMNRPRIATVLSAREWEPKLVDAARRDPTVRVVRRAYEPQDLDRAGPLDIVVVGAETSWITPSRIRSIRRSGTRVVGVYPSGDRPGHELLRRGGVDVALPDSTPAEDLLSAASMVAADSLPSIQAGRLISVTGPRGAPGRTEVAVALAQTIARKTPTAIVDLDIDAPGVAFRLGLGPGPGLVDLVDAARSGDQEWQSTGPGRLTVVGGSGLPSTHSGSTFNTAELLDTVLTSFTVSVADIGPWRIDNSTLSTSDATVLVCDAHPTSLIRAARLVHDWEGPVPYVVLNRAGSPPDETTLRTARRALGLEPHTTLPHVEAPAASDPPILSGMLDLLAADLLAEVLPSSEPGFAKES